MPDMLLGLICLRDVQVSMVWEQQYCLAVVGYAAGLYRLG